MGHKLSSKEETDNHRLHESLRASPRPLGASARQRGLTRKRIEAGIENSGVDLCGYWILLLVVYLGCLEKSALLRIMKATEPLGCGLDGG